MAVVKNIKINVDSKKAVKETEKLTKSFDKLEQETGKTSKGLKDVGENGGAIAVLDSLTGGLATQMKDAFEATKLFNFSLKGTKTALIATGIGAFLVAVGLVVAYWDDIVDFITQANKKLEEQLAISERLRKTNSIDLETNKLLEESMISQGKSTDKILKQRDKILKNDQLALLLAIQTLRTQRSKLAGKAEELSFAQRIGAQELKNQGIDISQSKGNISKEDEKALQDFDDKIGELTNSLAKIGIQRAILAKPIVVGGEDGEKQIKRPEEIGLKSGLTREDAIIFDSKKLLNERLDGLQVEQQSKLLTAAELEIYYRGQVTDASITLANNVFALTAGLAKEGSLLQKGIAIAEATRNTFNGVTAALAQTTDPTPTQSLRFGNAIAVGLIGLANVAKIVASKPIETGAPSGGQTGGRAPSAPSFNLVEGTQGNQIANSISNQAPIQTFVVGTAVTSQQSLDRNSQSNGTL